MTPDEMRRAASLLFVYSNPHTRRGESYADEKARPGEAIALAAKLRALAESQGWRDIATAPRRDVILLLVKAIDERRVFPAEKCFDSMKQEWYWRTACGYTEMLRLDSAWTPIGWQPLPPPPQGGK